MKERCMSESKIIRWRCGSRYNCGLNQKPELLEFPLGMVE
jgi:hypothetical protein